MEDTNLTTPVIQPTKTNWVLFLLVGIVILAVGIVVGLLIGKYIYNPRPTPTPLPTETLAKEGDPTANWKIYISPNKLFSVSLPTNWELDETNGISINIDGYSLGQISIHTRSDKEYVEGIWKSVNCKAGESSNQLGCAADTNKEVKILDINNNTVYWKVNSNGSKHAYIPNLPSNKTVEITFPPADQKIVDQILSTFRFVDQTSGVDTSNWKTYSGNGFVFKYPSGLTDLKDQGGVSGPWTGNPQSVINLGDNTTIHWGTDAPYDGFSVYTISKLASLSLLDYLHNEVEIAKNSPRGIKSDTITEISLGGQAAAFIDNEVAHREYFISSPDGKKIVVFSRINSTDSFLNTFDQILSTFKFTN